MADPDPTDDNAPKTADEILLGLLASGMSAVKAGKKINRSERTVRRRLSDPAFRKLLDQLKAEAVSEAAAILGMEMAASARELAKLRKRSKDEKIRLQASKEIIAAGARVRQLEELEHDVRELCERVERLAKDKKERS